MSFILFSCARRSRVSGPAGLKKALPGRFKVTRYNPSGLPTQLPPDPPRATPGSWPRICLPPDAVLPAPMGVENTDHLAEQRTLGNEAGGWLLMLEGRRGESERLGGRAGGNSDHQGLGNFLSMSVQLNACPPVTSKSYSPLPAPLLMYVGDVPRHECQSNA